MGTAHGRRHLATAATTASDTASALEGIALALVTIVIARPVTLIAVVGILGGHIEQSTI